MKLNVIFLALVVGVTLITSDGAANVAAQQQRDPHAATPSRRTKPRKKARPHVVNYSCPMHPDIRSTARGECPKCGMDLVKSKN